jgi:hypothetical protein
MIDQQMLPRTSRNPGFVVTLTMLQEQAPEGERPT